MLRNKQLNAYQALTDVPEGWDRHRRFYKTLGPFVIMDNGVIRLDTTKPTPAYRCEYPTLDLALDFTSTTTRTFKLPDGTPVKKAWLNAGGRQYLLIDHDSGIAVRTARDWLNEDWHKGQAGLPSYLQQAGAYKLGTGHPAVGGAPIEVSMPDRVLAKKALGWMKELRSVCIVTDRIDPMAYYMPPRAGCHPYKWFTEGLTVAAALALLDKPAIRRIAALGVAKPRLIQSVPYLLIEE